MHHLHSPGGERLLRVCALGAPAQPSPANGESSGLFSSVQWEAESPDLRPALPQHIPGVHAAQAGPMVLEQIP